MSSISPSPEPDSPSRASDKENSSRTLVMRDKGKGVESAAKRKRTMTNGGGPAYSRRRTATREPGDEDVVLGQYDPDQSLEEKRRVQKGFRDLLKTLKENGDEFLQADSEGLHETLRQANALSANVKQTTEATIDSKLLVNTVDASYRKTMRLTAGNTAQGIDVDEAVSKCITFMRIGGGIVDDDAPGLSSTQRQRRRPNRSALAAVDEDDEENGDEGDPFNWEHLGRFAGGPQTRRPATPGFLLGPLSVEKKIRKVVKRSAPFRPGNLQEVRPEVLKPDDIQKNENGDLAGICGAVLERLVDVLTTAQDSAEAAWNAEDTERTDQIMRKYGLKANGGIDLLRFVVNPRSFGQTVENMFYVSFLIRDAKIRLEYDDDGFATLVPVDKDELEEQQNAGRQAARQRQQAVFHLDMDIWRDIVEVYSIRESLIEHRKEEKAKGPGARGWYS
ncbi:hypothetical protein PG999_008132 [Apiospora kogelbergensis]|uniref:Non-structural maintenance of chromosomes element 4 n=1 Tax=Apiospora kogelbergensis TaxID=1337665 RepID=A0AAW0QNQ7_9PEZI